MTVPTYALDHAWQANPRGRRCAATDDAGRLVCPWPLDPALEDDAYHPWCDPATRQALIVVRHAEARRRSAPARAAAKGAAA